MHLLGLVAENPDTRTRDYQPLFSSEIYATFPGCMLFDYEFFINRRVISLDRCAINSYHRMSGDIDRMGGCATLTYDQVPITYCLHFNFRRDQSPDLKREGAVFRSRQYPRIGMKSTSIEKAASGYIGTFLSFLAV